MRIRRLTGSIFTSLDFLSEKSGFQNLAKVVVEMAIARGNANAWVPADILITTQKNGVDLGKFCIHLHIFHGSYLEKAKRIIGEFPDAGAIVVTSPSDDLLASLKNSLNSRNTQFAKVENIGRNFGALIQVMPTISQFEYVLHLHSKNTKNMTVRRRSEWSNRYWDSLASRRNILRTLEVFETDNSIALAYPELSNVLASRAYGWGRNRRIAQALVPDPVLSSGNEPLAFPVGGMFVSKTYILGSVFTRVGIGELPNEPLPLDGSVAHALERLVGFEATLHGRRHLILSSQDLFTTDTSFTTFRGIWG